jgi:hypothetical protein
MSDVAGVLVVGVGIATVVFRRDLLGRYSHQLELLGIANPRWYRTYSGWVISAVGLGIAVLGVAWLFGLGR